MAKRKAGGERKAPADPLPTREEDSPTDGEQSRRGRVAREFPQVDSKGRDVRTPFAGGAMVTFRFSKASYSANERDAARLLAFYRAHLSTWQAVKAWRARGAIRDTPGRDRKKSQGWAGRGRVVGYSTGKGPSQIGALWVNRMLRETQESVRAALTGTKGQYGGSMAVLYKPAPLGPRGPAAEFELNLFFDRRGLNWYRAQRALGAGGD